MRFKHTLVIENTFLLRKSEGDRILFKCKSKLRFKDGTRTVSIALWLTKLEGINYRAGQTSRYCESDGGEIVLDFTPAPELFASVESDIRAGLQPIEVHVYSNDEEEGFDDDDRVKEYFDKKLYLRDFGIDFIPESPDFLLHQNVTNIEFLFKTTGDGKAGGTFSPLSYFSRRLKSRI